MKKNSFNEEVKNEICNLEFNNLESYYILTSIFLNNLQLKLINNDIFYVFQSSFIPLIRLIKKLSSQLNVETNSNFNIVDLDLLNNQKIIEFSFQQAKIDAMFHLNNFKYETIDNYEKQKAFLLGAYLSTGIITYSKAKSSYHFEIKSHRFDYIQNINKIFNEAFNLNSKIITHHNYYVLYFKKAQYISDLLKIFNAYNCMYEFEDFRIKRDFVNSNQRLNNLDISNLNKTIKASNEQIKWIKELKKNNKLANLSKKTILFCELRLKNKDLSLSELVYLFKEKYGLEITRSTINYYINKIKNEYLKLKNK